MGAGKPDWAKLYAMGKLPKEARGNIPMLTQLDAAEKQIKELEAKVAELRAGGDSSDAPVISVETPKADSKIIGEVVLDSTSVAMAKCELEDCEFIAKGKSDATAKNYLRLHARSHEKKEK